MLKNISIRNYFVKTFFLTFSIPLLFIFFFPSFFLDFRFIFFLLVFMSFHMTLCYPSVCHSLCLWYVFLYSYLSIPTPPPSLSLNCLSSLLNPFFSLSFPQIYLSYIFSANIGPRSGPGSGKKASYGSGKQTLRLRANGPAQVEEVDDVRWVEF